MLSPRSKFVNLFLLCGIIASPVYALDELFAVYNAPQALAMGNAMVADASGYLSNYYNPAGLAKMPKNRMELNAIALESAANFAALGQMVSLRKIDVAAFLGDLQTSPGTYSYLRYTALPSIALRGFSLSVLANHETAALSDGGNVDVKSHTDMGLTVGFARNMAGNLVKLGVAGKFLIRDELKGEFAHGILATEDDVAANSREGIGFGIDVGLMVTLPMKYLPSLGVVARDVLNTSFTSSNILNSQATGTPDSIARSFDVGFSINPRFSRIWQTRLSVDLKHLERTDLPFTKRLHVGLQLFSLERKRKFYIWLGLNQLYPCGGVGLNLPGGNLELVTYAQDKAPGALAEADRRIMLRYTVGFF